jgi:hypothetical protein
MSTSPITPLSPYSTTAPSPLIGLNDVVDVINPLQHIPFVSEIYRSVTGDTTSTGAQIIGGGLFGGIAGAAVSAVTAMVEGASGGSMLDQASNWIGQMTSGEEKTALPYAAPTASRLTPDEGQALLSLLQSGAFTQMPQPQTQASTPLAKTEAEDSLAFRDFREERPLGIDSAHVEQQVAAVLTKQATKLIR